MSRLKHGLLLFCILLLGPSLTVAAEGDMEFYDPVDKATASPQPSGAVVTVRVQPDKPLLTIPPRFYGINIHPGSSRYELARPALIKALKPDSIRIMTRMRVDWLPGQGRKVHLLSPSPGVLDWSELDLLIDKITDIGAEPYLALGFGPPHWMTAGDDPIGRLPPRKDALEAYASHMADIVRRYVVVKKLPVRAVSIDNEPENVRYPIEDYIRLTRLAKTRINAVAPNVEIGGPVTGYAQWPLTDGTAVGFGTSLKRMKTESVPFDFIDWHIYSTNPEVVLRTVKTVRQTYGEDLPLVISELNRDWRYSGPAVEQSRKNNTEWESVAWLAYVYDRLQREKVERAYYFAWRENTLGLVDGQFKALRPNYFLFWAMTNHLGRNRVLATSSEPAIGCIATHDEGKLALLIYNRTKKDVRIKLAGLAATPLSVAAFSESWFNANDQIGRTTNFPEFAPAVDIESGASSVPAGGFLILKEN